MGQLAKKLLKEDGAPLRSEEALKLLEPDDWVGELAKYNSTFVSNDRKGSAGEEQQSGPLLSVNDVKAGDREVTGSVFVLPGQRKQLQISFPNLKNAARSAQPGNNSGEGGGEMSLKVKLSPLNSASLQGLSYIPAMK